ncbi:hypothetical protein CSUI_009617, partial [Cystoisospora suis]
GRPDASDRRLLGHNQRGEVRRRYRCYPNRCSKLHCFGILGLRGRPGTLSRHSRTERHIRLVLCYHLSADLLTFGSSLLLYYHLGGWLVTPCTRCCLAIC